MTLSYPCASPHTPGRRPQLGLRTSYLLNHKCARTFCSGAQTGSSSHPSKTQAPPDSSKLRKPVNGVKGTNHQGACKKNGAGGKGTWGRAGDEYASDCAHLDKNDPNYDPDEEEMVLVVHE